MKMTTQQSSDTLATAGNMQTQTFTSPWNATKSASDLISKLFGEQEIQLKPDPRIPFERYFPMFRSELWRKLERVNTLPKVEHLLNSLRHHPGKWTKPLYEKMFTYPAKTPYRLVAHCQAYIVYLFAVDFLRRKGYLSFNQGKRAMNSQLRQWKSTLTQVKVTVSCIRDGEDLIPYPEGIYEIPICLFPFPGQVAPKLAFGNFPFTSTGSFSFVERYLLDETTEWMDKQFERMHMWRKKGTSSYKRAGGKYENLILSTPTLVAVRKRAHAEAKGWRRTRSLYPYKDYAKKLKVLDRLLAREKLEMEGHFIDKIGEGAKLLGLKLKDVYKSVHSLDGKKMIKEASNAMILVSACKDPAGIIGLIARLGTLVHTISKTKSPKKVLKVLKELCRMTIASWTTAVYFGIKALLHQTGVMEGHAPNAPKMSRSGFTDALKWISEIFDKISKLGDERFFQPLDRILKKLKTIETAEERLSQFISFVKLSFAYLTLLFTGKESDKLYAHRTRGIWLSEAENILNVAIQNRNASWAYRTLNLMEIGSRLNKIYSRSKKAEKQVSPNFAKALENLRKIVPAAYSLLNDSDPYHRPLVFIMEGISRSGKTHLVNELAQSLTGKAKGLRVRDQLDEIKPYIYKMGNDRNGWEVAGAHTFFYYMDDLWKYADEAAGMDDTNKFQEACSGGCWTVPHPHAKGEIKARLGFLALTSNAKLEEMGWIDQSIPAYKKAVWNRFNVKIIRGPKPLKSVSSAVREMYDMTVDFDPHSAATFKEAEDWIARIYDLIGNGPRYRDFLYECLGNYVEVTVKGKKVLKCFTDKELFDYIWSQYEELKDSCCDLL